MVDSNSVPDTELDVVDPKNMQDVEINETELIDSDHIDPDTNVDDINEHLSSDVEKHDRISITSSMNVLNEDIEPTDDGGSKPSTDSIQTDNNQQNEIVYDENSGSNDLIKQVVSAAQRGNIKVLKYYLESSKENPTPLSPNITDSEGITLIHWAALNNKLATIKYLVALGANPDIPAGEMNATPLLWAVRYGLVYIADWLITEANADPNATDKNGIGILLASVFSSNVMMVVYVIWKLNGKSYPIKNIGIEGIDSTDLTNRTALHWASYQGDFLTVDVLLNAGAKTDLVDSDGFTPLHWGLVNGSKSVITSLIDAKCNINAKTSSGKSSWDIAADMNSSTMWACLLKESGRNTITGDKIDSLINKDWANLLIFTLPFITLPLATSIFTMDQSIISKSILIILIFILQQLLLKRVLVPCLGKGKINLLKTPFFSGVFFSTTYWCIITWIFKLMPQTFFDEFITNVIFILSATGTVIFSIKAMIMDPGYIPKETEHDEISSSISELIKVRKFDSNHFCIYSNIRKPLRSKYSKEKGLNIARFDHYCPWVNNNIGVRNHKVFFAFVLSLEIGAICWLKLALEYFSEIDLPKQLEKYCDIYFEDLCKGSIGSKFLFYFFLWVSLQLVWLTMLLVTQMVQISKGLTTYEFSHKHRHSESETSFSSVPADELSTNNGYVDDNDNDTDSDIDGIEATVSESLTSNISSNLLQKKIISVPLVFLSQILTSRVCRMIGLDQMVIVTNDLINKNKQAVESINYNYGSLRNWLDFLFLCRIGDAYSIRTLTSIPVKGENNLNGILVDYYELYNVPESV